MAEAKMMQIFLVLGGKSRTLTNRWIGRLAFDAFPPGALKVKTSSYLLKGARIVLSKVVWLNSSTLQNNRVL